jgi:hypothetical protein
MKQASELSHTVQEKVQIGGRARDEVFSEVNTLLDRNSVLQIADFDYRIRQHLHALLGSGGREKLHSALESINSATSKKSRHDVKNWPAYLRKLLTKFEADFALDKALEKDREERAQAVAEYNACAKQQTSEDAASSDESLAREVDDSKKSTPRLLSDEEEKGSPPKELSDEEEQDAWIEALDKKLSAEDQWLSEIVAIGSRHRQPPPPKEAPPPPPKEMLRPSVPLAKPPMQPPSCLPPAQMELQASHGKPSTTVLDFPLEHWAAWLSSPSRHIVVN